MIIRCCAILSVALMSACSSDSVINSDEENLTVACEGTYAGAGLRTSKIKFKISIYPAIGKSTIFDLDGYDVKNPLSESYSLPRSLLALEDSAANLKTFSTNEIKFGKLEIDRSNGQFSIGALDGVCEKTGFVDRGIKAGNAF